MEQKKLDFSCEEIFAVIRAALRIKVLFPNNKGKIYVSNILSYFVNVKNHSEVLKHCSFIPDYKPYQVEQIFRKLSSLSLLRIEEGNRGSMYAIFFEKRCLAYLDSQKEEITQNDINNILRACLRLVDMFPTNKGKVYITNVLAYFGNDKNIPIILKNSESVPNYSRTDIDLAFDKLNSLHLLKKEEGKRGATFAKIFTKRCEEYLNSQRELPKENDLCIVLRALLRITELLVQNKGKIYISNVLSYFVNKNNEKEILKHADSVPNFTIADIENIFEDLSNLHLLKKEEGKRGATFVRVFVSRSIEYLKSFEPAPNTSLNELDYKNIVFASLRLIELFPTNKCKVYTSNVKAYFLNEINHPEILKHTETVPSYTDNDVESIFDTLTEMHLCRREEGKRGATYIKIFVDPCKKYVGLEQQPVISNSDLINVLYSCLHLIKIYPANKGKVYLTNVFGYFDNEDYKEEILKHAETIPSYDLKKIERIFDELANMHLLRKEEGKRGAIYARIFIERCKAYLDSLNPAPKQSLGQQDIINIIYASLRLAELFPANKCKVYTSNVKAYFLNEINHPEILKHTETIPSYTDNDVESIFDTLTEMHLCRREEGKRGATYIRIFVDKCLIYLKQFNKEYSEQDLINVLYACLKLNGIFPKNKGKVYATNVLGYFVNDKYKDEILKHADSIPNYSIADVDHIFDKLAELHLLKKEMGDRGGVYAKIFINRILDYLGLNKRSYTEQDLLNVIIASIKLVEIFPKNNGKVYATNVLGFFVNETYHAYVLKYAQEIPTYDLRDIDNIFTELEKLKYLKKYEGNRGAIFAKLFLNRCLEFVKLHTKTFEPQDLKNILFACLSLDKQFPANKHKVYISNVVGYFVNKANEDEILSFCPYIPSYSVSDVSLIFDELQEMHLLRKEEGKRGAVYALLFLDKINAYIDQNFREFDPRDLQVIIYSALNLAEMYPNNKGKVYVSNLHAYCKATRNKPVFRSLFGFEPDYSFDDIENMVSQLDREHIFKRYIGDRGATYIKVIDKNYFKYYDEGEIRENIQTLLIKKIMLLMNGRCYPSTIENIIFNHKAWYVSEDMNKEWTDLYFPNRSIFETPEELYSSIVSLLDKQVLYKEGNYVVLTHDLPSDF